MAPPLWAHADLAVGCLDAGKHVLCEKMMAWDVPSCERMREAARAEQQGARDWLSAHLQPDVSRGLRRHPQDRRARRHLSRPPGVASQRQLAAQGRPAARRLQSRRSGDIPTSITCSTGACTGSTRKALMAELCSHQINATNWFLGSPPRTRSSALAACIASLKAARSTITSTRPSNIPAAGPRCSRRSNRTRSTTTTRCSWARRAR